MDPIKYYEYRALGLPVLSTRFGEMARREREPGVFLVEARAALGPQVHRALRHRDSDDAIRLFRANNSWRVRFDATCSAVNAGRGPTGSGPRRTITVVCPSARPTVSIIVVSWNSGEYLRANLDAIFAHMPPAGWGRHRCR